MKKLKIAVVGCGARAVTYLSEAIETMPLYYEVVGGADPVDAAVDQIEKLSENPNFRRFKTSDELLAADKFADVLLIATQDHMHYEPCMEAMRKGYDILLEKPVAPILEEVVALETEARRLGRHVMVCHVYRYAPFYLKAKEIIDSGVLGDIITVNASEGVEAWHQGHSFVRGKWAVSEKSTPMILAKCCHDLDYLSWLIDEPCISVASFGELTHFTEANAPEGAPDRCTDGCPVSTQCMYNALRYAGDKRIPWLPQIMPEEDKAVNGDIVEWLKTSPWGRCVYRCDNDVVDHQVLAMKFARNITCTFTMTAFDKGRNLEIFGTKGVLRGGEQFKNTAGVDIVVKDHNTGFETRVEMDMGENAYYHHEGGDSGLVQAIYPEMYHEDPPAMRSSITRSVQSHVMAFAAERSRLTGKTVLVEDLLTEARLKVMGNA